MPRSASTQNNETTEVASRLDVESPASDSAAPRRPELAPMVGAGAAASVPSALAFAGAPWWMLVVASLPGTAAFALSSVFPQDSHDRLEWFTDRRRHKEELVRSRTADSFPAPGNPAR